MNSLCWACEVCEASVWVHSDACFVVELAQTRHSVCGLGNIGNTSTHHKVSEPQEEWEKRERNGGGSRRERVQRIERCPRKREVERRGVK